MVVMFALSWVFWPLAEHHVPTAAELGLLIMTLCLILFNVIVYWVIYIALEPFVRRRWPQMLISWSRLLSGEWRDPLVGRDVLAGCAAGAVLACLLSLYELIPRGLGYPGTPPPPFFLDSLHSTRSAMAQLSAVPSLAIGGSLYVLFVLFFLRVVVRRDWLAAAAWVLILSVPDVLMSGAPLAVGPVILAMNAVSLLVLLRLGFLPSVVTQVALWLFKKYPMTFDTSAWYFGLGFIGLFAFAAIALYGFRTSLGGRPALQLSAIES